MMLNHNLGIYLSAILLGFADCAQIPLHSGIETPPDVPKIDRLTTMPVEYGAVASKLQAIQPWLKQW